MVLSIDNKGLGDNMVYKELNNIIIEEYEARELTILEFNNVIQKLSLFINLLNDNVKTLKTNMQKIDDNTFVLSENEPDPNETKYWFKIEN